MKSYKTQNSVFKFSFIIYNSYEKKHRAKVRMSIKRENIKKALSILRLQSSPALKINEIKRRRVSNSAVFGGVQRLIYCFLFAQTQEAIMFILVLKTKEKGRPLI